MGKEEKHRSVLEAEERARQDEQERHLEMEEQALRLMDSAGNIELGKHLEHLADPKPQKVKAAPPPKKGTKEEAIADVRAPGGEPTVGALADMSNGDLSGDELGVQLEPLRKKDKEGKKSKKDKKHKKANTSEGEMADHGGLP